MFSRNVESLGPGPHVIDLNGFNTLAPGVYWIRLVQSDRSLIKKGVVLK